MTNLSNLDGVRAIAVLLVVLSHLLLQLSLDQEPAAYRFKTLGHVGVAIFFVHTTLVLMASLERHGSAPLPFYVRRFFRIYPLSIAMVLLLPALQLIAHVPVDTGKLVSNLFLVQNITGHGSFPLPLWSLPYEVQMYLVLPAIYLLTMSRWPVMWVGLLLAGSILCISLLPPDSLTFLLTRFVPCFVPGVLAFVLCRRLRPTVSPVALFALLGVGALTIPALVAAGVPELPLLWALCVAIALAIAACRQVGDGLFARGSALIAKYSYGIYLTHMFALLAVDKIFPAPAFIQWPLMLILLATLSYLCYHGIEKRGVALGARLADRLATPRREPTYLPSPGNGSG
jgi:peptidoglycan/LPS O-acetylase OafA/YrhL